MNGGFRLENRPAHLGGDGRVVVQPQFAGDVDWYALYDERQGADDPCGRLLTRHLFTKSWTGWEMHPAGDEIVLCVSGGITLIQQSDDAAVDVRIDLGPGDYAVNPAGVWHTADVDALATVIFITPGSGTSHRPRLAV